MADARKVERVEKQLDHHLNNGNCSKCSVKGKDSADCINNMYKDALSVIRELKAENERLRQEKDDAVKRIKTLNIPVPNGMPFEAYVHGCMDTTKMVLDVINSPSI